MYLTHEVAGSETFEGSKYIKHDYFGAYKKELHWKVPSLVGQRIHRPEMVRFQCIGGASLGAEVQVCEGIFWISDT